MTSAAAPSEIDVELAAVTVPPSRKAGFSVGILSGCALPGCSSSPTVIVALAALDRHRRDLAGEGAVLARAFARASARRARKRPARRG